VVGHFEFGFDWLVGLRTKARPIPSAIIMTHDIIIIGAGHNGLVASFYLARAGYRVLVVEAKPKNQKFLTDGNIHHVDATAGQILWRRPLQELANYRTPIPGLYLCGSGTHPWGEVSGAPGHNAAHVILDDLGGVGVPRVMRSLR
jgi:phytoene dehydrogenase-like protein